MSKLTKVCFKCKEEKTLDNFYKHKQMTLGVVNKCKTCNKLDVKENYRKKSKDPSFVENERKRCREKYHRLNYKEKQKEWDADKPWKKTSTYKSLSKVLKIPKGFSVHHWNYFKLKSVIILNIKEHRQLHEFLELDLEKRIFKVIETGFYLDTKEKHIEFIKSKGYTIHTF